MVRNEMLLNWMRTWELDDSLYYKKSAIRQACFMRDEICMRLLKTPCFVISSHVSKSCLLPVYMFRMNNGIEIICRDNFYGWVVSVKTPTPECEVYLPTDLVHGDDGEDIHHVYCEGFRPEWVYSYDDNHRMTFRVDNDYQLWALMRMLNIENWGWNAYNEEVFLEKEKDVVLDVLCKAKTANPEMGNSDIFCKTFYYDTHDYYKGCYDMWRNDEELAEHIIENQDIFDIFAREWQTIRYGLEFGNKEE